MLKNIDIYGAQLIAGTVYSALSLIHGTKVNYFIVSDKSGNPDMINGIEVITLSDYILRANYHKILIATPEEYHIAIAKDLEENGLSDYVFLTSKLRNHILEAFYADHNNYVTLLELGRHLKCTAFENNYMQDVAKDFLSVYMVRSNKDRKLKNSYAIPEWVKPIQAGAKNDNGSQGILRDDEGLNISDKNRDYCELTVLYWIWKNDMHEYAGLCHYRRVFNLNKNSISIIRKMEPDVILPYPTIHIPDIKYQYKRYLIDEEFIILYEIIKEQSPEMSISLDKIRSDRYFLNYNMLIAKRSILIDYCDWLFRILEKVEKVCYERKIHTSNRYAGYMGEILCTLYFMFFKNVYKIVFTGVDFLL